MNFQSYSTSSVFESKNGRPIRHEAEETKLSSRGGYERHIDLLSGQGYEIPLPPPIQPPGPRHFPRVEPRSSAILPNLPNTPLPVSSPPILMLDPPSQSSS